METNTQKQDQKIATFFGASHVEGPIFQEAERLGFEFCKRGFTVRSGAQDQGTGLMSAVSIGAERANKELNLKNDIDGVIMNVCWGKKPIPQCTSHTGAPNLGQRTEQLCEDVKVFVVLPGGKGTLLEIVYLINSRRLPTHDTDTGKELFNYTKARIYVYGKEWKILCQEMVKNLSQYGMTQDIIDEFLFFDNGDQILEHLNNNPL